MLKFTKHLLLGSMCSLFFLLSFANAQEAYFGEIRIFAFNFCPEGWAAANGQLLEISNNQALFSLLGTYYGGDGIRTFALPDLRGRLAMHQGFDTRSQTETTIGEQTNPQLTKAASQDDMANYTYTQPSPSLSLNFCISMGGYYPPRN